MNAAREYWEIRIGSADHRPASSRRPIKRLPIVFQKTWARLRIASLAGLLLGTILPASPAAPSETAPGAQRIVSDASWNEMHPSGAPRFYRYRLVEQDPKGSDVKLVIETNEGAVARLVEKGGKPLTEEENTAEVARLKNLLANPQTQLQRYRKERQNDSREDELVRMLPDAFLYADEGTVQGPSGSCYRLSFKPNPNFVPPDREGEVFHGMIGELWVDQAQLRIVRIDAHLISDVNFGWGVLGRLYRGGSILEENADVGDQGGHHWESTSLRLRLTGKILMIKNVDFSTSQSSTDFQPVASDITYQQAIRRLLNERALPTAATNGNGFDRPRSNH
jgi:hypothetical protein